MTPPSGHIHPPPKEHPEAWYRLRQNGPPDSGNSAHGQRRDFFPDRENERELK